MSHEVPLPRPGSDVDRAALTPAELEVLFYLSKGFTDREIGDLLSRSKYTVNDQMKSVYRKLVVSGRVEAAVLAAKAAMV